MTKSLLCLIAALTMTGCSYILKPTRPADPVVKGIHYVGVSVSDINEATRLYQGAFDLTLANEGRISGASAVNALAGEEVTASTRLLRSSNGQIRLMQFQQPAESAFKPVPVEGPGWAHICVQVNHKTRAYERFLQQGGVFIGAQEMQQLNPANPVYYGYAYDFDNTVWEIEHVDVAKLDLPEPPKNQYRLRQIALATPDIERAVAFYSTLLETRNPKRYGRLSRLSGEKFDNVSGLKDSELQMGFFQVRNMEIEMSQYFSHPTAEPKQDRPVQAYGYNMVVFDVTSLSAVKRKLVEAGARIVSEGGQMDGVDTLFARDPDGNLMGFQVLPEDSVFAAAQFKDNGV